VATNPQSDLTDCTVHNQIPEQEHQQGILAMKLLSTILIGGLIAGALDITYAFIVYGPLSYGMSPADVLHSVASGWLGKDSANSGGTTTALLGLITHFMIAAVMAAVYVLMAGRWPVLKHNAIEWGLIYGFGLYLAMTYLVVPLSAAHPSQHFAANAQEIMARLQVSFGSIRPRDRWQLLGTLFTHMVFVGLPIALVNRRRT
jgi:uncharacterized membrane protein YagU involved in acid resistance